MGGGGGVGSFVTETTGGTEGGETKRWVQMGTLRRDEKLVNT